MSSWRDALDFRTTLRASLLQTDWSEIPMAMFVEKETERVQHLGGGVNLWVQQLLDKAEPITCTPEMGDVARSVFSATKEQMLSHQAHDLITTNGLFLLDSSINMREILTEDQGAKDWVTDDKYGVIALAWFVVDGFTCIIPICPVPATGGDKLIPTGIDVFAHGEEKQAGLLSVILLLGQTLASRRSQLAHRASRRAAGLAPEQGYVTIVDIRRRKPRSTNTTIVEWTHRWVQGEHWRMQPYGPGRSLVKPVLIGACVKGPEDKPLVVRGERVWRLVR